MQFFTGFSYCRTVFTWLRSLSYIPFVNCCRCAIRPQPPWVPNISLKATIEKIFSDFWVLTKGLYVLTGDSGQVIVVFSAVLLCIFPILFFIDKNVCSITGVQSEETQKKECRDHSLHIHSWSPNTASLHTHLKITFTLSAYSRAG